MGKELTQLNLIITNNQGPSSCVRMQRANVLKCIKNLITDFLGHDSMMSLPNPDLLDCMGSYGILESFYGVYQCSPILSVPSSNAADVLVKIPILPRNRPVCAFSFLPITIQPPFARTLCPAWKFEICWTHNDRRQTWWNTGWTQKTVGTDDESEMKDLTHQSLSCWIN